jgi:RNA polymerase sigma factor (sigma-70 family)
MGKTTAPPGREADHAAVDALARRFTPALVRYFERRGVNPDDADDAVQEVFVRLARREGFAGLGGLEPYLFETAANVAIDLHRRGRARRSGAHDSYDDDAHGQEDFSPERVHAGREELNIVLISLMELPERTRSAFVLARFEGMRHAEIGRRLGVSVSGVEKHLARAIAHLAERLERTS